MDNFAFIFREVSCFGVRNTDTGRMQFVMKGDTDRTSLGNVERNLFGAQLKKQRKKFKSRINSRNTCYYSVKGLLSYSLLSNNLKITI
jgi:hypothetical protein